MSPNNNIGESYKTFGITDKTTNLIAVKLPIRADGSINDAVTRDSVAQHLATAIEGESVELDESGTQLGDYAEVHRIKKAYKLNCAKGKGGKATTNGEKKDDRSDIEAVILGTIALKGW